MMKGFGVAVNCEAIHAGARPLLTIPGFVTKVPEVLEVIADRTKWPLLLAAFIREGLAAGPRPPPDSPLWAEWRAWFRGASGDAEPAAM